MFGVICIAKHCLLLKCPVNGRMFKNRFSPDSNSCEENIYISISLEKRVDGRWFIFAQDIFHVPYTYKVQNIIVLKGCEVNQKEEWKIKNIKYKRKDENIYRFKYNIGRKLDRLSYTEYSNMFHINKNVEKRHGKQ